MIKKKVYRPTRCYPVSISKKAEKIINSRTEEEFVKITFPLSHADLDNVRSLPGRKYYDRDTRYWTCPIIKDSVRKLKNWGFRLDKELEDLLLSEVKPMILTPVEIPGLKGELFPYQREGVAFIDYCKGRALIADEMGLGKTVQALAWLQLHLDLRPAIVVTPASLKLNWKKEALKWMPHPKIQILSGNKTDVRITGEIIIINYDILSAWVKALQRINPKVMITDEAHYYKNGKAKRSKAVMTLGKSIPKVIALSGTPIINKPIEFFNCIKLIRPSLFTNQLEFARQYCGAKHNGFGWDFSGASNTQELHSILTNSIMIRRKKVDVLKDLPDKIYNFIPLEIDNSAEYNLASTDFETWLRDSVEIELREKFKLVMDEIPGLLEFNDHKLERLKDARVEKSFGAEVLVQMEHLKQIAVRGKLVQAIEWITDFLDSGEKLVVFAIHRSTVKALNEAFPKISVRVDGSVNLTDRDYAVTQFQTNPKIKLFIGNQAAGEGLTLTAASNIVILELPVSPGKLSQWIDRVHRISQLKKVLVTYLIATNTIEEDIASLVHKKMNILNAVLDGTADGDTTILSELIETIINR